MGASVLVSIDGTAREDASFAAPNDEDGSMLSATEST